MQGIGVVLGPGYLNVIGAPNQLSQISTICSNTVNAFIIAGPNGLGKKNFIFKLCKFMLCHFELNEEISSKIFEINEAQKLYDAVELPRTRSRKYRYRSSF